MDILEVIKKVQEGRHLLEVEIAEYLKLKMRLFELTYGISPKGLEVIFIDITNIESRHSEYILSSVQVDLGKI